MSTNIKKNKNSLTKKGDLTTHISIVVLVFDIFFPNKL